MFIGNVIFGYQTAAPLTKNLMNIKDSIEVFTEPCPPQVLFEKGFLSIMLLEKGFVKVNNGIKEEQVTVGTMLIHTPGAEEFSIEDGAECSVIGIRFKFDVLKKIKIIDDVQHKLFYFENQYLPIWRLTADEQKLLKQLLDNIAFRLHTSDQHLFGKQLFELAFSEFILELANIGSKLNKDSLSNYTRGEYLTIQFIALARQHYKVETKLEFYASKLSVTTKYLSETVKQINNKTAKEILLELRLSNAKFLLSKSDLDIKEIAYQLGYDSLSTFSRYFKEKEGISPKEYKDSL